MAIVSPSTPAADVAAVGTFSGNEITDAERLVMLQPSPPAGSSSDGATVPAGVGIWHPTTNLVSNGGFETSTSGWGQWVSSTIARDTTVAKFGGASLRVTTDGTAAFQGASYAGGSGTGGRTPVTAGQSYAFGVWAKGDAGGELVQVVISWYDSTPAPISNSTVNVTLTQAMQNFAVAAVAPAGATLAYVHVNNQGSSAYIYWLDGAQFEQSPNPTPYVETAGVQQSRGAARVQLPSSLLSATQMWLAMRVRLGWGTAAAPISSVRFFEWGTADFNNRLVVFFRQSLSQFAASRLSGGAGGGPAVSVPKNAGDAVTIVASWTATAVSLSIDGSAFTSSANATIPDLSAVPLANIGSDVAGAEQLDSAVTWLACGVGAVTDQDAAAFAALPDIMPSVFPDVAASLTSRWLAYTPVGPKFRRVRVGDPAIVVG